MQYSKRLKSECSDFGAFGNGSVPKQFLISDVRFEAYIKGKPNYPKPKSELIVPISDVRFQTTFQQDFKARTSEIGTC